MNDEETRVYMTLLIAIAKHHGLETAVSDYESLRDCGILPDDFTPWPEAGKVLRAESRETALASLHPEQREAVQILLDYELPVSKRSPQ